MMNCETVMRHGIMLKALVVCSVEWCLLTVVTMHNDELSGLFKAIVGEKQNVILWVSLWAAVTKIRQDDVLWMMSEVKNKRTKGSM